MARPDLQQIRDDERQLLGAWQASHAQWQEIDTFTNGKYWVWDKGDPVTATRNETRTNRGRVLIDHAVDNLLPYMPKFSRDRTGQTRLAQRKVDAVEEAAQAIWVDACRAEMVHPAKLLVRNLVKYNYGILETGFREREDGGNPFLLRAPHPYSVLLPPRSREPEPAVRREQWYKRDLEAYLRGQREGNRDNIISVTDWNYTSDGYQKVAITEHFTKDTISLMSADTGGELLLQAENVHQIIPFVHGWGGFGDMEASEDGMMPEKLAQGLIWPVRTLIRQYDQVRSAKMRLYMMASYGMLVTAADREALVAQLGSGGSDVVIGNVKVSDIGYIPIPQLPQFLADLEDRIDREIVEATFPRASFGQRDVGVDTVGQHAMMLSVSSKRFTETTEQTAYMVATVFGMWAQMMETYGKEIEVRGKRLSPAMLQERRHMDVSFPVSDEAVRAQRKAQGMEEVARGLKSKHRYWTEDAFLDNTSKEEDRILEEAVLADPILASAFANKKREELGVQELYEEQLVRMAQEGASGSPQPMESMSGNGRVAAAPQTEAQLEVEQAEESVLVRPPPSRPGAGQGGA